MTCFLSVGSKRKLLTKPWNWITPSTDFRLPVVLWNHTTTVICKWGCLFAKEPQFFQIKENTTSIQGLTLLMVLIVETWPSSLDLDFVDCAFAPCALYCLLVAPLTSYVRIHQSPIIDSISVCKASCLYQLLCMCFVLGNNPRHLCGFPGMFVSHSQRSAVGWAIFQGGSPPCCYSEIQPSPFLQHCVSPSSTLV